MKENKEQERHANYDDNEKQVNDKIAIWREEKLL